MAALKQKILLCLLAGLAFGFSYTAHRQWKIIKEFGREWGKINKKELQKEIANLYRSKTVDRKENPDGSYTIVLTQKGKMKALTYFFDDIKVKNKNWDGKWRLIAFDIPERLRAGRDALREKLRNFGFYELQKSVFVFPYECWNEINFIVEFFDLRKYTRLGILETIDNEVHLKQIFKLN